MVLRVLIAAAVTLTLGPVVRRTLDRLQVRDEPNWRSSHSRPTPRGGGLAVAAGITVALVPGPGPDRALLIAVLLAGLGLGAVGLADDVRRGISPLVRLLATAAVAGGALVALADGGAAAWSPLLVLAALGWIVAYVNAFNFMDGINGISAAQTVIAAVGIAVAARHAGAPDVALVAMVVAGAAVGFAPHNVPAARLFLGDVGSYLLGGVLGLLAVAAIARGAPVEAVSFAFLLYAADTAATFSRRLLRGDRWWDAHREHAYQQLVDAGWSHTATAAFVAAMCSLTSALGLVSLDAGALGRIGAALAAGAVVAAYLATPALVTRRRIATARTIPAATVPVTDVHTGIGATAT
jgi:UDP-GlcNAc:undecaprenyl-phosphate GlcNAc-1-phosphate transferase